jgi:arginine repressor
MPRPKKEIPFEDVNIKGIKTLLSEGKTQNEIAEYYKKHGIDVNRVTILRRIKELKECEN